MDIEILNAVLDPRYAICLQGDLPSKLVPERVEWLWLMKIQRLAAWIIACFFWTLTWMRDDDKIIISFFHTCIVSAIKMSFLILVSFQTSGNPMHSWLVDLGLQILTLRYTAIHTQNEKVLLLYKYTHDFLRWLKTKATISIQKNVYLLLISKKPLRDTKLFPMTGRWRFGRFQNEKKRRYLLWCWIRRYCPTMAHQGRNINELYSIHTSQDDSRMVSKVPILNKKLQNTTIMIRKDEKLNSKAESYMLPIKFDANKAIQAA